MNASSGSPFPELLYCGASNDVPNLKEEKFGEGQEEEEGSPERNNKHGDTEEEEIHKNLETTSEEEDQLQHLETPLNPSSSSPNFPYFSSLVFQDFPPNISLWRKLESSSSSSFSSFPSSDSFEDRQGCCWKNVNALLTRLFAICVCLNNQSQPQQPCGFETPNPVEVPTVEEQAFVPAQENTYTDNYSVDHPINAFGSVKEQVSQRNTLLVEEEEAHDRTVSIPAAEDVHERENKKQMSSAPKNQVDQPSLQRISVPVPLCEDGQHSATPNLNNIPPKDSVVGEASGFLNLMMHQPSNVSAEIPKPAEMVHCKRPSYNDNNDFKPIYRPKQGSAFRTDSEWNRATFEELKNVKDINFASMVEQYRNRFFYYKPLYDDHELRTRAVIFPRLEQNRIMDCLGTILSIELFPDKEEQKSSPEKE